MKKLKWRLKWIMAGIDLLIASVFAIILFISVLPLIPLGLFFPLEIVKLIESAGETCTRLRKGLMEKYPEIFK